MLVDWDDVLDAANYKVYWRLAGPGNRLNEGVNAQSSDAVITVEDYGEWVVRVEACNDAGCGPGAAKKFRIVLAKPTGLASSTTVDSLAVSVTWDAVDDATSYKLQWRKSDAEEFDANDATTVTGTNASITVSGFGKW